MFFGCFSFFIYNFVNDFQNILSYRLGTVNDFHWVFKPVLIKPVLSYIKPHSYSTFFGEEKEINMHARTLSNQRDILIKMITHFNILM